MPIDTGRVLTDVVVAAPRPAVWAALQEPELVRRWFGWEHEDLDREIHEVFVVAATRDEDAGVLAWPDGDRLVVSDAGEGRTRVQAVRGRGAPGDGVDQAWTAFLHQLRFALERHPDEVRRTVCVQGLDDGSALPLLDLLGVQLLDVEVVGSRYVVQPADGSLFSGEVLAADDGLVVLSVREEGDGLLVVSRTPGRRGGPAEVGIVLSTYGYTDDRLAAAAQRWEAWWSAEPSDEDGVGAAA